MKNIKISKNLKAMIIRITLLILFIPILGKICFGQAYHQTVYSNIDGTTYVTHINGYGSTVNVSTYEVTPKYATLEEIQQGAAELHDRLNELAKEREERQSARAQYINEQRMKEKLEKGIITQEEYDAAVAAKSQD